MREMPGRRFSAPSVSTTRKELPWRRQDNLPGRRKSSTCCMLYRPCRR